MARELAKGPPPGWTPDDLMDGDTLTRLCPRCGAAAEWPDCEGCGFRFDEPGEPPAEPTEPAGEAIGPAGNLSGFDPTAHRPREKRERIGGDLERVREALSYIPPDPREKWVHMAFAVKSELGEAGRAIWDAWSQQSDSYTASAAREVWKSASATGGVKGGTLFHEAKLNGWRETDPPIPPTPAELAERQRQADEQAAKERAKSERTQAETAKKARLILESAPQAEPGNPYLSRKGVAATATLFEIEASDAARILGYPPKANGAHLAGRLLVAPITREEQITSLELIDGDGRKAALSGSGTKSGGYWLAQPLPEGSGEGLILPVAEGVATTLSVLAATGYPAVAALSLSNFSKTLKAMRARHPRATLLLLADLDKKTGTAAPDAVKAAKASGALLIAPDFGSDRPDGATDFNDLHQMAGLDAVRAQIERVIVAAGWQEPLPEPDGTPAVEVNTDAAGTDEPSLSGPFPPAGERPCYVVLDDWTEHKGKKHRPGVYACGAKERPDGGFDLFETWFCSPLYVDAITFDGQENNFGRLLRFRNPLKKWREWAMPMELLSGSGETLRAELLAMGVDLDPYQAKKELPAYLQREHPKRRMHCALQTGWTGDSFVLPDVVIGPSAAGVIFQSGERQHDEYTTAGTLDGWKATLGALAVGNPMLMESLSAGFTGPLLAKCSAEGGGVHHYGDSSTGKTTLIEAACSIWGGATYRRSWKGTANGQEAVAALFNDNLLALDEISEADPREVGSVIYQLGNGRGKQRASRSGAARSVARWRCMILSTGERTIATTMLEGGHRAKAGQSVRMLDIPVARRYGAWDDLHSMTSGAAFSDAIKRAAATQHGHVGRAFLERLTRENQDFSATLEQIKAMPLFAVSGGEGQDKRAAARFALIGMAGELATEYGLTGWHQGDALKAAALCLRLWQAERGTGNNEQREVLEKVSRFIERHGDSRFSDADATADSKVYDRAGWWKDGPGGRQYLFNADGMREALTGFDFKRALDVLQGAGAIDPPKESGERARFERIDGRGVKVYRVYPDKLTDGATAGGEHGA
ncbi:DUF927 domain-containing protein [Thiocystis violascens]|nr:DUF927 domain-containing protein [Thiocystis violascens]